MRIRTEPDLARTIDDWFGGLDDLVAGVRDGHASAVLAASIFHFGEHTIGEAKRHMAAAGIAVRMTS